MASAAAVTDGKTPPRPHAGATGFRRLLHPESRASRFCELPRLPRRLPHRGRSPPAGRRDPRTATGPNRNDPAGQRTPGTGRSEAGRDAVDFKLLRPAPAVHTQVLEPEKACFTEQLRFTHWVAARPGQPRLADLTLDDFGATRCYLHAVLPGEASREVAQSSVRMLYRYRTVLPGDRITVDPLDCEN